MLTARRGESEYDACPTAQLSCTVSTVLHTVCTASTSWARQGLYRYCKNCICTVNTVVYCEYSMPKNAIISGTKRFTYREFSANEQICCIYFVCYLCIRHVEGSVTCEKCHWPICSSSCISLGKVVLTLRQCEKCLDISIIMFRYIKIQVK